MSNGSLVAVGSTSNSWYLGSADSSNVGSGSGSQRGRGSAHKALGSLGFVAGLSTIGWSTTERRSCVAVSLMSEAVGEVALGAGRTGSRS